MAIPRPNPPGVPMQFGTRGPVTQFGVTPAVVQQEQAQRAQMAQSPAFLAEQQRREQMFQQMQQTGQVAPASVPPAIAARMSRPGFTPEAAANLQQFLGGNRIADMTQQQRTDAATNLANTLTAAAPAAGIAPGTRVTGLSPQQQANFQAAANRQSTGTEQFQTAVGDTPLTGLEGATQAINQGQQASISALERLLGEARGEIERGQGEALDTATGLFERGVAPLEGIAEGAVSAQQEQLALSGALGPDAQAAAFARFQESPEQAFLREQGERALTRNAAALGGLGGGEVRRELARFGTGLAAQDFQNRFNRLGSVADRGLSAAGAAANLGAGQAGLATGIQQAGTEGIAGLLAGQGRDTASILGGAANRLADFRTQAGRDLANAISGTTQGIADLSNEQGRVLQDIFGEGAANVANLMNLAGEGDAQAQEQLGQLLANLNTNEATLLANLFTGQGSARLTGDLAVGEVVRNTTERLANTVREGGDPLGLSSGNAGQVLGGIANMFI